MPTRPRDLQPGATIGIVAPSSPTARDSDVEGARSWLTAQGLGITLFPHLTHPAGGNDDLAADLTAAFADPQVDVVLAMRGGTGGWRMVLHVDFEVVRANPEPFCGFSDITALPLAIATEADLVTSYGPNAPTRASFIEPTDVLVQVFERRVLTYTPSRPADWKVESGNIGRHYSQWYDGPYPADATQQ